MGMKKMIKIFMVGLFLLGATAAGFCAEETKAAAMSPEQQAMMGRMKEYSTPNEHHQVLAQFEGSWKTTVKFWMDPAQEPEVSEGVSEAKMIMDGRFLGQSFTGTAMGKSFIGKGIYGYDNMKKEYTSIWFDNMATGIMVSAGQYDGETNRLKEEGSMSCPITNETNRWYRAITTFVDADHYTYETYMKDKDGKEFMAMQISYTRVKDAK
jgi:hypothetical protein